jgi:hypothetical protein
VETEKSLWKHVDREPAVRSASSYKRTQRNNLLLLLVVVVSFWYCLAVVKHIYKLTEFVVFVSQ